MPVWTATLLALIAFGASGQQEDISRYIEPLERALQTTADPGLVMYGIARTYAADGQSEQALRWLQKTIALNQGFDPSDDEVFSAMRSSPGFRSLMEQVERATLPVRNSRPAFRVVDPELVTEGLAYDPVGRKFYLGSVAAHKVLEVTRGGKCRDFATDGLREVLGMKVDPKTGTLWVVSNGEKESALLHYDLRSRKLIKKYPIAGGHLFNDLTVSSRGAVFVTDTKSGTVYWIDPDTDVLAEFVTGLSYPNGIALSGDGRKLFVAHFSDGVSVVDVATRGVHALARPSTVTLATVDGLYFYRGSLIAIQNGVMTHRVARFYLNSSLDRVNRFEVLERRNPWFDVPTTGAIVGREFYYIANSQLHNFDKGRIISREKLRPVQILKVKLR